MKTIITLVAFIALSVAPANARHHYRLAAPEASGCLIPLFCASQRAVRAPQDRQSRYERRRIALEPVWGAFSAPAAQQRSAQIVSHPAGCPAIAFCGCGAAVRVFGRPIRELWLAANWYKFPRTAPAAGMVAVRAHHVFVLEADLGGGVWQVYDANSGGHATRIHPRSLAGYTVVNPKA